MSSETNSPDVTAPTSAPSSSRKGKGVKQRAEQAFRRRKNASFQRELQASIMSRLKITDPTNVSSIPLQSAVVPARIPVSLRAIPTLLKELWDRMLAIGTRPFQTLATDYNRAIFFRVALTIFEAKVCYAQRLVELRPPFDLPSQFVFSEMALRQILSVAHSLPFPLAIALECLGNFSINRQSVVPVFIKTAPDCASGAVSLSRFDLSTLVNTLAQFVPVDNVTYTIAQELADLPMIVWDYNEDRSQVRLSPASVAFWTMGNDPIPAGDREIFLKLIASMESKKGFLIQSDISTGQGSAVPLVRFHERFCGDEVETLYYMNEDVSEFNEQIAAALMYGYEYGGEAFSRFTGSYDECFKHGSASQAEARHALVWADKTM